MARIKHIAIRTETVEKTAAFYRDTFELQEVGKGINGVYLSDGHINLAVLNVNTKDGRVGVDHLGFLVDDIETSLAKVSRSGGRPLTDVTQRTPADDPSKPQSYFEIKVAGPDDQEIDISTVGWVGAGK